LNFFWAMMPNASPINIKTAERMMLKARPLRKGLVTIFV
jgi:hypothetical protein